MIPVEAVNSAVTRISKNVKLRQVEEVTEIITKERFFRRAFNRCVEVSSLSRRRGIEKR